MTTYDIRASTGITSEWSDNAPTSITHTEQQRNACISCSCITKHSWFITDYFTIIVSINAVKSRSAEDLFTEFHYHVTLRNMVLWLKGRVIWVGTTSWSHPYRRDKHGWNIFSCSAKKNIPNVPGWGVVASPGAAISCPRHRQTSTWDWNSQDLRWPNSTTEHVRKRYVPETSSPQPTKILRGNRATFTCWFTNYSTVKRFQNQSLVTHIWRVRTHKSGALIGDVSVI